MKCALALSLVTAQFVLLAVLVLLPHGTLWPVSVVVLVVFIVLVVVGVVLAVMGVLGLGSALTASPIPRDDAPLVTTGVYGLVRSPVYSGLMTGGLGLVLFGASIWHAVGWVLLVVLLAAKTRWEERMLIAEHPEYLSCGARIGRFVPGIGRLRQQSTR